jgi:hypothetical protein
MEKAGTLIAKALKQITENSERTVFRFDIFKGAIDANGKVQKVKSVGHALINEGTSTYTIYLKSLLKDQFFMLPERTHLDRYDFVILTREDSFREGRKYFWNNVGEAKLLDGENRDLLKLTWDLFAADDLYLNTLPTKKTVMSGPEGNLEGSDAA